MNCHTKEQNATLPFRHYCDTRDGGLWMQATRIECDGCDAYGFKLTQDTKDRLAESTRLRERALNRLRVHHCSECKSRFIAHWQARACSDTCAELRTARLAREAQQSRHWNPLLRKECAICRAPIQAKRASKMYCSAKCRQAGHRKWG